MDQTIWNATQDHRIDRLEKTGDAVVKTASKSLGAARAEVRILQERVDQLTLICRSMHELLVEHGVYPDRQLNERITEVDGRDGQVDGRITPQQKACPRCDAKICAKFNRCLFCGFEDPTGDPFQKV